MYINGTSYSTPIKGINAFRAYMFENVYTIENINRIMGIISHSIDCSAIAFDPSRYEINICIKKTTMRKTAGYEPNVLFYYNIVTSAFIEFLTNLETPSLSKIIRDCNLSDGNPHLDMESLNAYAANAYQIVCIGDKNLIIKL